SARGQQLEDHYFGSIPSRIAHFMHEVEFELYKLGVPVKTRHNEVAPSQFELAPIFEDVNIASDHNLLTMEILRKVAARHGLACLLHEKPFAGINGSGKHNNWSLSTDQGENLLEPGQTPHENLRFLAVLAVILKAVHEHADVLRLSIASPGNDHRLGANEAPPAIISVFLGSLLEEILEDIESGKALKATEQQIIDLGINKIPAVSKDSTDRNRTSPFAFTGNKFEFRAVGSSQNCAVPMSVLNAAVAASFRESGARLKQLLEGKTQRDPAIMELIRQLVVETKDIRFSGNGYSQEWRKEAKKRKLPILNNTPEALSVFTQEKSIQFLLETKIFSQEEIESRHHVAVERYLKTLEIELLTLQDMLSTLILPALYQHLGQLDQATRACSKASLKKRLKREQAQFESQLEKILQFLQQFNSHLEKFKKAPDEKSQMLQLLKYLLPTAQDLRSAVDEAELVAADDLWPLPKYREMLLSHGV
ncbi:MAG: glutamine synthetase type III, partial [Bdellovibrio sp.]